MAAPPPPGPPQPPPQAAIGGAQAPAAPSGPIFYGGSTGVVTVKALAMVMILLAVLWYYIFIVSPDSPYLVTSYIFAGAAIGIGVASVWMGNVRISRRAGIPTLNSIMVMVSILLLFIVPILGSWQDPRSLGEMFENPMFIIYISLFALFTLSYIEFSHATIRFSQIDQYARSQNIEDFSVNPVIWNYFIWYGILTVIIYFFLLGVIFLRWAYMPALEDTAPQFANSIEMNSVYSIVLSIGIIFIPITAVMAYIFGAGSLIKTTKEVIVKGPETEEEYYGMEPRP